MELGTDKRLEASVAGAAVGYFVVETRVALEGGAVQRYGVAVERAGERASFGDVFATEEEARGFLDELCRGQVTPVTLGDVVYDRLCR